MEITYNKKVFKHNVKDLFNMLTLQSHLEPNKPITSFDISTIYSGIKATLLQNQYENWDIVVRPTPPPEQIPRDIEDLGPRLAKTIKYIENLTKKNKFNDIDINGIPFDFKYVKPKNITMNGVHVYI